MDDNSDIIETLLGITDSKDKVIMSIEEGNEDSDFTVRVFDLSDDTEQELSLIHMSEPTRPY